MIRLKRLVLLGAFALIALVGLAPNAAASRGLAVSPAGTLNSSGTVTFTAPGLTITCAMSMTESVSRLITKTVGATASSVTAASLSGCNAGVVPIFLFPVPWTGTYSSFTGTLPSITEVNGEVGNAGLQLTIPPIGNCLYGRGFRWKWLYFTWIAIRRLTWLWVFVSGSASCPLTLAGGGDLTAVQRHTLTLV